MKRTAINLTSVIGGEALQRGANFLAVVVIARLYGAGMLGLYATALAYVTVAAMIAENGLQISSIAEITRFPAGVNVVASSVCSLRLTLFGVMSLVLAATGWWERWPGEVWIIGVLTALRVFLQSYSQLQFSVLKGLDRMPVIGPIQTVNSTVLLAGIAATYYFSWRLNWLLACFVLSQGLEIMLSLVVLWKSGIRPTTFPVSGWWRFLKRSAPVGLAYALLTMTMRADVIVLSAFGSLTDVGHFSGAHMGIVLFYSMSWLLGSVLLPDFSRLLEDPVGFERYTRRWTNSLLLVAGLGAIVLSRIARPAMLLLYGKGFAVTGDLASVMVLAVPFILLNAVYFSRAVALASTRVYLATYTATTVLAILLDIILVRNYGAMGIAVAIVIRELVTFLIFRIQAANVSRTMHESRPLPVHAAMESLDA